MVGLEATNQKNAEDQIINKYYLFSMELLCIKSQDANRVKKPEDSFPWHNLMYFIFD